MHKEQKVGPVAIENIESVETETLAKIEDQILPLLEGIYSGDPVDRMMNSIPKVGFKNLEESIALGKRIEKGRSPEGKLNDDAVSARDELIFSCALISRILAVRYSSPENPVEDLFQEGLLGLQKAAEQYDWKKNLKFSTYGYLRALWAIQETARKNSKFAHENSFTDQEKPEDYKNEDKDDFGERVEDKKAVQRMSLEREIAFRQTLESVYAETRSFPRRNKRSAQVLLLRLGCDENGVWTGKVWTTNELRKRFDISGPRVFQLQKRAAGLIKDPELQEIVRTYLDPKK